MEQSPTPSRALALEQAKAIFALQLIASPELMAEVDKLTARNVGVLDAVIDACADGMSYDPDSDTTPERIRHFVGAPLDDSQLEGWREPFYMAHKNRGSQE